MCWQGFKRHRAGWRTLPTPSYQTWWFRLFRRTTSSSRLYVLLQTDQIAGDKVVVIDFWATWCGPCKMISPIFDKISETPASQKLDFYKVDVDEQSQIAAEVRISAMPTFVFFKNGQKVDSIVGADPSKLQETINKYAA